MYLAYRAHMSNSLQPVALVDDHQLVRTGIAGMIDRIGGYRVISETSNGLEFVGMLNEGGEEPRIAVVDLHMPIMDGFETIAWLRAQRPSIMPLALTFDPAEDVIIKAVRSGARGLLSKNAPTGLLKTALDSLMLTGYYHTDEVHETLVQAQGLRTGHEREQEKVLSNVSPRELEFLKLVCSDEEHTYEQIADKMNVHRRTVDGFRESLAEKFGIKSKTGLVLFAMKWGIVKP
jgi:two-component system invasion response regulator UvrY